jgi:AcrR family transcriptional regulator
MPANQFPAPARRADAERNRDKILAAARTAFADPDAEVSMAEISRRAGVGMATLYRNFPGRQELLEALFTDEVDALCEAARTIDGETPGTVLVTWLHRFFAFITGKRNIAAELLKETDRSNPLFKNNRTRVITAGRPLLAAAQNAGEVRDDLALEQILDMIVAIATIHGDTGYTAPILQAALDGLRPLPRTEGRRPDGRQPGATQMNDSPVRHTSTDSRQETPPGSRTDLS